MFMQLRTPAPVLLGAVATLSLLTGACATKKHVREAIAPVQTQVGELQKTTQQQQQAIGDLDRNVSRADEHAMEADRKATAAGQSADKANQAAASANQAAQQASQNADKANQSAQQAMSRANGIADNINNYKLITTEKVYFKVNKSSLGDEDRQKLDAALQQVQSSKNYVIEVAGYTDKTGSQAANLELARRRAEAVVRYLTVDKNVPLRAVHDVGVGSEFPDATNKTRAERKENRRVDVKLYTLDMSSSASASNMPSQTPAQTPTNR
jgi:outer membrane protein OmpA-like peptidoglycan-associated protein